MAEEPVRTTHGALLFIPANGTNNIQAGQRIPGTMVQPLWMPQNGGRQNEGPRYQSRWRRICETLGKFIEVETKTLGAIQIITGLIHVGLGIVSLFILIPGGIWPGIFFIASGSLSVLTAKRFNNNLMKCSLYMNITSAILAVFSIILYLIALILGSDFYLDKPDSTLKAVGFGISFLLLLFSVLEFVITVLLAHFGCQTLCCNSDPEFAALPCTVDEDGVTVLEANPPAPNY